MLSAEHRNTTEALNLCTWAEFSQMKPTAVGETPCTRDSGHDFGDSCLLWSHHSACRTQSVLGIGLGTSCNMYIITHISSDGGNYVPHFIHTEMVPQRDSIIYLISCSSAWNSNSHSSTPEVCVLPLQEAAWTMETIWQLYNHYLVQTEYPPTLPHIHMPKPNLQCDGVWRQGL